MSRRYGGSPAGTIISIIADIAALILILWIAAAGSHARVCPGEA